MNAPRHVPLGGEPGLFAAQQSLTFQDEQPVRWQYVNNELTPTHLAVRIWNKIRPAGATMAQKGSLFHPEVPNVHPGPHFPRFPDLFVRTTCRGIHSDNSVRHSIPFVAPSLKAKNKRQRHPKLPLLSSQYTSLSSSLTTFDFRWTTAISEGQLQKPMIEQQVQRPSIASLEARTATGYTVGVIGAFKFITHPPRTLVVVLSRQW